jgi:acyl carrier protein
MTAWERESEALSGRHADIDMDQGVTDTERLDQAIRDGLALPQSVDVQTIAWGQTEGWDSVAHMQLVAALEAAFGIMIDTDDVIAMSDYAEIRRIVSQRYGVEFPT